jgi:hypothetical protein
MWGISWLDKALLATQEVLCSSVVGAVGRSVYWSVDWSVVWSVGRSFGRLVGCFVGWSVVWSMGGLVGWKFNVINTLIIKANEMHYFSDLFDKVLYVFRTNPLSIIRSISTLYTRKRYLSCKFRWRLLADTYCVYTVLRYSWWWTVGLSETCRVLYEINLRNSASNWLPL